MFNIRHVSFIQIIGTIFVLHLHGNNGSLFVELGVKEMRV